MTPRSRYSHRVSFKVFDHGIQESEIAVSFCQQQSRPGRKEVDASWAAQESRSDGYPQPKNPDREREWIPATTKGLCLGTTVSFLNSEFF